MSLEKRIKRRIIGRRHDFFAVTLPGFERLCTDELAALSDSLQVATAVRGGVAFSGRMTDLYLAALHVRTPVRLLMRLARFKATNFKQLERQVQKISWELHLPQGALPECHVTAHHSRLYHTGAIAGHIAAGIADHWSHLGVTPDRTKGQTLHARLDNDAATLSLDACGAPLYLRGLKPHAAGAPLRETTAAAILRLAGYRPASPLLDPMCGSGTFSLEAALISKAIPPGSFREFAFMQWPAFRQRQWDHMKRVAEQGVRRLKTPRIQASDIDHRAMDALRSCIAANRLDDAVALCNADFFSLQPGSTFSSKGLMVLNPPFGKRLAAQGEVRRQYQEIATKLKNDFKGWHAALLVPQQTAVGKLDLRLASHHIRHGGLDLALRFGRI